MLSPTRARDSADVAGGKPLALAAPPPLRRKVSRKVWRPDRDGAAARPLALLGLCLIFVLGGGIYALRRLGSLREEITTLREQTEQRIQQLDAGIAFDSKRRRLLLGIRDEVMAANKKLGPDLAYEYATHLVNACEKYPAVDPLLMLAIGIAESGFEPSATSRARARGLYQIWPSTGRVLAGMLGWQFTDDLLYEPARNTAMAALYLDILFSAYKDPSLVLAEYNGGPLNAGYLRAGGERASPETRTYVARVLGLHERLKKKFEQPEALPPGPVPGDTSRASRRLGERAAPVRAAETR